jgi:hypothetical protein
MDERQKFEEWAVRELLTGDDSPSRVKQDINGNYKDRTLQVAWYTWQAAWVAGSAAQFTDSRVDVVSKERMDTLINTLDAIARDYDPYEYGLPIYDADGMLIMRLAVETWLSK